jgi:hypothetical protein
MAALQWGEHTAVGSSWIAPWLRRVSSPILVLYLPKGSRAPSALAAIANNVVRGLRAKGRIA